MTEQVLDAGDADLVLVVFPDGRLQVQGRRSANPLEVLEVVNYAAHEIITALQRVSVTARPSEDGHTLVVDGALYAKVGE